MRKTQSRARRAPLGGALSGLALLVVAVVMTACSAPSVPQATPAAQASPSAATPAAATQPAPQATSAPAGPSAPFATVAPGSQEVGASAGLSPAAQYVTHWKGDANAKVVIIEISDFQWPYCGRWATGAGRQLEEKYVKPGEVRFGYMHMAFLGEESQWAAEASECAGEQDAFWQYHDKLFESQNGENQGAFNKDKLKGFAKDLGLKTDQFDQCLDSGKYTQKVQQQTQAAQALGVQSTPSFFVNDWLVLGALPVEEFDTYIAKAKAGQKPPPTPTPLPQGVQFWQPDPQRPGRDYDGSYYLGDAKAPVVILAFEDFSSPDSAEHAKSVEPKLKSDYLDKGLARYVVQLYPLNAPKAAAAALCAGQQGKFFEFRNLLLTKQAEWKEGDEAAMQAYAKSLGLDEAAFAACLKDEKVQAQIDQYISFGQKEIQVPQAPSYLMLKIGADGKVENAKGFPGALPAEQFFEGIQQISVPPTPTPTPPPSISKAELASLQMGRDADGNFYRGDPNAPVKLVDFSDFQWPFCGRHAQQTEPLLYEAYVKPGKVVQIYRNFPLSIHPNAPGAAKAALCAGDQDPKLFWEMHDWLFESQNSWQGLGTNEAAAEFRKQAVAIGVDGAKYDACIADPKTEEKVQKDMNDGSALGVRGTPAFFLYKMQDGKAVGSPTPLSGALPYQQFSQALDELLKP